MVSIRYTVWGAKTNQPSLLGCWYSSGHWRYSKSFITDWWVYICYYWAFGFLASSSWEYQTPASQKVLRCGSLTNPIILPSAAIFSTACITNTNEFSLLFFLTTLNYFLPVDRFSFAHTCCSAIIWSSNFLFSSLKHQSFAILSRWSFLN